jgi:hypothetical protein
MAAVWQRAKLKANEGFVMKSCAPVQAASRLESIRTIAYPGFFMA